MIEINNDQCDIAYTSAETKTLVLMPNKREKSANTRLSKQVKHSEGGVWLSKLRRSLANAIGESDAVRKQRPQCVVEIERNQGPFSSHFISELNQISFRYFDPTKLIYYTNKYF